MSSIRSSTKSDKKFGTVLEKVTSTVQRKNRASFLKMLLVIFRI